MTAAVRGGKGEHEEEGSEERLDRGLAWGGSGEEEEGAHGRGPSGAGRTRSRAGW